jgi:phosphoribosylcarboxyaminoimidazole (NCAIR) mutase
MASHKPLVGIVMGSDSDLEIMKEAASVLKKFEVPYEMTVASAHEALNGHRNMQKQPWKEESG